MLKFEKITEENFDECVSLEVKDDQKTFVAPNMERLAQAYVAVTNEEKVMPFAIYDEDNMVGFIMLNYNWEEDMKINACWVCRLMIDKKYQGRGYGKKAMEKALDFIRTQPSGKADAVLLSYEPENNIAAGLYKSMGFKETGVIEYGEVIVKLDL